MRARLLVCVCTRARVLHAALHSTIFTKFRHIYIGGGGRMKEGVESTYASLIARALRQCNRAATGLQQYTHASSSM